VQSKHLFETIWGIQEWSKESSESRLHANETGSTIEKTRNVVRTLTKEK
jgi:hypothetical protein